MNPFPRKIISRPPAAVSVIALLVLALAGCTMIPKYQRPQPKISSSWPGYATNSAASTNIAAADIGWRDFFRDTNLQQVIELALTNNANLISAVQNVDQERALYHVQALALVPTGDLNANYTRQKIPNIYQATNGITYGEYQVNIGIASYELDLFGAVRSLKRQALENYFAAEEGRRSAQIALVSQVATAYLSQEEAAEQLALSREMLDAARKSFDLTKQSFEAGVDSQFDLNNASTLVQSASTAVANSTEQYAEAADNLTFLVGEPLPPDLAPSPKLNADACLSEIPAGLPSDLLERRPDVLQAEHQLEAANANIGAARAAFFPTITLTGDAGYASTKLSDLFTPGSKAWEISPQIVWPIFASGTAYQELKAVKAVKRMQIANYQNAVQTAFREVADALATRAAIQSELADTESLVQADQQSYDLTDAGFRSGVNSTLDLLVTLQTLDTARQNLIQIQYSRLMSLINLYQALGGGWNENTVQSQQSAQK
jgi:multidrug efflux system outer membrane protein